MHHKRENCVQNCSLGSWKPESKRPDGRYRNRSDDIKMDLRDTWYEVVG
jgi:hypothetical protein